MSPTLVPDVCRVTVHIGEEKIDLTVPLDIPLPQVISGVVDIAARHTDTSVRPVDWQLARLCGSSLDARLSLRGNDIHDGDVLMLTRAQAASARHGVDDFAAAAAATLAAAPSWTPTSTRRMAAVVTLWCSGLAGFALLHRATPPVMLERVMIPAVAAGAALIAAVTAGRACGETVTTTALGTCASLLGAVAGYLAVPGAAAAPKFMLAAAVSLVIAVIAVRCTGHGAMPLTAIGAFSLLSMIASCGWCLLPLRVGAAGAVLAATAVAALGLAAKLAIWAARLPLPRRLAPDLTIADDVAELAGRADMLLNGVVCGFTAAAVLGSCLSVLGGVSGLGLAAVVGVGLLLRSRTHADTVRTAAFMVGGTLSLSAVLVRLAILLPQHAHWLSLVVIAAAAVAIRVGSATSSTVLSPVIRRCVDLTEYVLLAAVIPLALWACGVYGAVRALSLS